ncbi:hypothetical protein E2C01_094004 [Portunus trituberculatus]|uniref:Secreted protein n=1 Tax=Portunus trituberculatus TaxID=210409 RepID=A0A5B7JV19_PORTR|nr:hypothetical protein [Portunus trituberculatus]
MIQWVFHFSLSFMATATPAGSPSCRCPPSLPCGVVYKVNTRPVPHQWSCKRPVTLRSSIHHARRTLPNVHNDFFVRICRTCEGALLRLEMVACL